MIGRLSFVLPIEGRSMYAELYVLDMLDFDVILGMDWSSTHYARIDCRNKEVKFEIPGGTFLIPKLYENWAIKVDLYLSTWFHNGFVGG